MIASHEPSPVPAGGGDGIEGSAHGELAAAAGGEPGERLLLEALRRGDESAFASLVERHHASMIRLARTFVSTSAAAEEVAQEAWLGVLEGLSRFEGRSSLKAWMFSILANCARTRGQRDGRFVPFSSLGSEDGGEGAALEPERFLDPGHPRWPGHWVDPPQAWGDERLVARETLGEIAKAIEALPPAQRAVMTMRDVEGLESAEARRILGISEANQRVLLHRARSKVRKSLEGYMRETEVQP